MFLTVHGKAKFPVIVCKSCVMGSHLLSSDICLTLSVIDSKVSDWVRVDFGQFVVRTFS